MFKDHHVPLNNQEQEQQENVELADEQEMSHETQNERPLTPIHRQRFENNLWVNSIKTLSLSFKNICLAYTTIKRTNSING